MTVPWQWRLDDLEPWQQRRDGPDKEWRFYPGTAEPHLRLIDRPEHQLYVVSLVDTFLGKKQCEYLANSMLAEYPSLKNQKIIEVDWEMCK